METTKPSRPNVDFDAIAFFEATLERLRKAKGNINANRKPIQLIEICGAVNIDDIQK